MVTDPLPLDDEPDIVIAMIREVLDLVPLTREQQEQIEYRLKRRYGDQRVRVKKRLQLRDDELRAKVFKDGESDLSNEEIARRNGVSPRTVYYWMKQGNRRPGR